MKNSTVKNHVVSDVSVNTKKQPTNTIVCTKKYDPGVYFLINDVRMKFDCLDDLYNFLIKFECVTNGGYIFSGNLEPNLIIKYLFFGYNPWEIDFWDCHYRKFPILVGNFEVVKIN